MRSRYLSSVTRFSRRVALPDSSTAVTVTTSFAERRVRAGNVRTTDSPSDATAGAARTRRLGSARAPTMQAPRGQRAVIVTTSRWRAAPTTRSAGGVASGVWSLGRQDSVSSSSASSK